MVSKKRNLLNFQLKKIINKFKFEFIIIFHYIILFSFHFFSMIYSCYSFVYVICLKDLCLNVPDLVISPLNDTNISH
ncbi:hypothetical protein RIR_jg11013.t1 [Rhizophagus irregularis DAOM 181602=DAOM 197198]|uniref:Uncharacterized protein n=1 Tax=Rhizophagus irregularis (strain DAOM 181602 / DAOM 197198 / MUCL 43194) TaxID=747089 RepID=U9SUK6_RHIID|nr:hypothetical protein RIR_jg11013.t1 [Rhizophagus irregularis DAOM 181602=DAOM 197198]